MTTLPDDITVYPNVTGITLNETDTSLFIDNTLQLIASITPEKAWDKSVHWSSADESIATVDENGLVTPVSSGTVVVTATTVDGGIEKGCTINITIVRWHTMIGGGGEDYGWSIDQSNDGGYIAIGSSNSTDLLNLIRNNNGGYDFYILKRW